MVDRITNDLVELARDFNIEEDDLRGQQPLMQDGPKAAEQEAKEGEFIPGKKGFARNFVESMDRPQVIESDSISPYSGRNDTDVIKSEPLGPTSGPDRESDELIQPQLPSSPSESGEKSARQQIEIHTPSAVSEPDKESSEQQIFQLQPLTQAFNLSEENEENRHDDIIDVLHKQSKSLVNIQTTLRNLYDHFKSVSTDPDPTIQKDKEPSKVANLLEYMITQNELLDNSNGFQEGTDGSGSGDDGGFGAAGGAAAGAGGAGLFSKFKDKIKAGYNKVKGGIKGGLGKVKNVAMKNKKVSALVAGGTALAGTSLLSGAEETAKNNIRAYPEEKLEDRRRRAQGLPEMSEEERVAFRAQKTRERDQYVNPNTGYPLVGIKHDAVNKGLVSPQEAANADRSEIISMMNANGVSPRTGIGEETANTVPGASPSQSDSASMGGIGTVALGAGGVYGASKIAGSSKAQAVRDSIAERKQAAKGGAKPSVASRTPAATATPTPTDTKSLPKPGSTPNAPKSPGIFKKGLGYVKKGARGGILTPAMTVYDAYGTVTDDELSTNEKAAELTDTAGSAAGGMAGAAAGAAAGSIVPVVGTAIGGLLGGAAGYYYGGEATKSAREAVGWTPEDEGEVENAQQMEQQREAAKNGDVEAAASVPPASAPAATPEQPRSVGSKPGETFTPEQSRSLAMGKNSRRNDVEPVPPSGQSDDVGRSSVLGSISARFESGGGGVNTVNEGDNVKTNYGKYQLSSESGDMSAFLNSPEGRPFAGEFGNAKPGTPEFNNIYKKVAENRGSELNAAQSAYVKRTHYQPMANKLRSETGLDVSSRGQGVKEAVYSTAVQYGPDSDVLVNSLKGKNVGSMSDKEVVRSIYNHKSNTVGDYFSGSSEDTQKSISDRINKEREEVQQMTSSEERNKSGPGTVSSPAPTSGPGSGKEKAEDKEQMGFQDFLSAAVSGTLGDKMSGVEERIENAPSGYMDQQESDSSRPKPLGMGGGRRGSSGEATRVQGVSDEDNSRQKYQSVKKVMMTDPTVKQEREKKTSPSTKRDVAQSNGTYNDTSIQPKINETPTVVQDNGLVLLNTGFI